MGPVLDSHVFSNNMFHKKVVISCLGSFFGVFFRLFLPCIYDSVLVYRPLCSFNDTKMVRNPLSFSLISSSFILELPYNQSLSSGLTHLISSFTYFTTDFVSMQTL